MKVFKCALITTKCIDRKKLLLCAVEGRLERERERDRLEPKKMIRTYISFPKLP